MQEQKKLLTAEELSQYLGIPIQTIYTYKCRGKVLPKESIVKLPESKKLFFDKTVIDEWVTQHHPYQQ